MSRISREWMFIRMAQVAAERSTCARGANGAVLVHQNNIISIGYNGPPPKTPHCNLYHCNWDDLHAEVCLRSIHAEENALRKLEFIPEHTYIYVTSSPCPRCTQRIIEGTRITKVFFQSFYHTIDHLHRLEEAEIELIQVTPGFLIDYFTKKVLAT